MSAVVKARAPGAIKSALLKWLGVPIQLTNGEFWSAYYGATSASGQAVTVDRALQLSTVWACVRLLAETIATLPLNLYERTDDGGRKIARNHPLYELIHNQPNADMTAAQFWEVFIVSMLLPGTAFVEKARTDAGRLVALDFMLPQRTQVTRRPDGSFQFRYQDLDGAVREISEASVWMQPGFTMDGVTGLSSIQYGANVFGNAMSADQAAGRTFKNGMLPTVVFEMERVLQKGQREEFRENLKEVTGAINAGKSPLLEGGMKANTIGINPSDAQLLESRGYSVEEICRWFRIPPFMVGHTANSTSWGTGIEQQMIGFLAFALRPWLTRIEQGIRKNLLLPAERSRYFAEFSIEGLLRADSAGRAQFFSVMVQNGLMTRNEARAKENLPPVPGGDELTVQSNLLPIDQLGKGASSSEQVKNALLSWLQEDKSKLLETA